MNDIRKGKRNMNDVIVQFAYLLGMTVGSARCAKEKAVAEKMADYNSEELLEILSGWAEAYFEGEETDTVSFFEEKIEDLLQE